MKTLTGFLALCLAACTSAYVPQGVCSSSAPDVSTEGSGRGCGTPTYFKGTGAPGSSCSSASDCAPICCGCKNGNGAALAALCQDRKCATAEEMCCGFDQHSDICRRGASSLSFKTCSGDGDCGNGLTCIKRYQVTSSDSQIGAVCDDPYQQKICTKHCSSDSDCTAYDGACTGADACNGSKNLCYQK